MTVIERAARALAELEGSNWNARNFGETPSGQDPEDMRQGYRDQARAVLQAIREPSEGMIAAGTEDSGIDGYVNDFHPIVPWQAMIDKALEEE